MDQESCIKTRAEDIATGVKTVGMAGGMVRLISQTMTIPPKDLETYAYAIRDKEIYLKAQGSLAPFIQSLKP